VDTKPPRLESDERATVMALLQYQRDSFVRKLVGVNDQSARQSLVRSGTSLLWLANHMADAEMTWVMGRCAGGASEVPAAETLAAAIDRYRSTWDAVGAVVTDASLDDLCSRPGDGGQANLRWVLMHLLEETARHAGHADILRELIDGRTGR